MEDLWNSVLSEIQLEVSKGTFYAYFKKTSLASLEDDVATISVPTFIVADQVEKRYSALIRTILEKKLGKHTSIIFTYAQKKVTPTHDSGPLFVMPASQPRPTSSLRIKQEYKFETLAVSDSNQLAYTASFAVSEDPGKRYNPLFLYGSVGVGKTHLMHSIANKVLEKNPQAKILYLTTEEFTNEVVEAIMTKSTSNIRKKFRHTDLLLLDDIQFLAGKEKVQEELFHTFNALIDGGGQIVFSSDRPPSEIKKIEARLASRFEGGLTVDIEPPDFELRTAILLIKSKKYNLDLTSEIARVASEKIQDTRALEGFLLRLASFQLAKKGAPITEDVVLSLLNKTSEKKTLLHPDMVIEAVCAFYSIKSTQLKGVKRDSFLVKPRHMCMYLLKEDARLTYSEIGNLLGGRDHTTVMHGVLKIEGLLTSEERLKQEALFLREKLSLKN